MANLTITANLTTEQQFQVKGRIGCVYSIPVTFISGANLAVKSEGYALCEDGKFRTVNTDYIEQQVLAVINK